MKEKLDVILLIDDDLGTNYIHERILNSLNCCKSVLSKRSGMDAIEYLKTPDENGSFPQPELILLDINMPEMNGWEFLDVYDQLPANQQAECVVVMVTNSIHPDDMAEAKKRKMIAGFMNKPLSKEMVLDLLKEKFPYKF